MCFVILFLLLQKHVNKAAKTVRSLVSKEFSKNIFDVFAALNDGKEYEHRIRVMHLAELELNKEEIDFRIISFEPGML